MPQLPVWMQTGGLLVLSNIFMTFAWYAHLRDLKTVGRVAGKAFAYFLFFSTLALIIGLVVVNVVQPGAGMHVDPNTLDTSKIAAYAAAGEEADVDRVAGGRPDLLAGSAERPVGVGAEPAVDEVEVHRVRAGADLVAVGHGDDSGGITSIFPA